MSRAVALNHDNTLLISILYIKNTNKAGIYCSRVLISILYIKNTNKAVYLLNL
jgi:hypothetical protein